MKRKSRIDKQNNRKSNPYHVQHEELKKNDNKRQQTTDNN